VSSSLYFVAGETSGDQHGAALMQALRARRNELAFSGRGGPRMQKIAGGDFGNWIEAAGVVGLWEVLKHYGYFRDQFHRVLADIAAKKPAAVVLIDYPGFNLRLAKALRQRLPDLKIIYYISPQVWAWNRARIPRMARYLDLMLCIFPFEAELYERSGLRTIFVGHPMIESLREARVATERDPNLIGLFPGSRAREVRKLMPVLREVMEVLVRQNPSLRFEIAAASERLAVTIRELLGKSLVTQIVVGESNRVMQRSFAGIVASGTATLEAAYFRMPFLLIYKVSWLTYLAGRLLIRVKHLGMPNVLAGREIVPEFIQHAAQPDRIAAAVLDLMTNEDRRSQMIADFDEVIGKLGGTGASERAASAVLAAIDSVAPNEYR
jgi:lipid-A-disaccharide synthase